MLRWTSQCTVPWHVFGWLLAAQISISLGSAALLSSDQNDTRLASNAFLAFGATILAGTIPRHFRV
jgi:hypothetical protein